MVETMKGGKPDRFVKGYEALQLIYTPYTLSDARAVKGGPQVKNKWGVTISFPSNAPGPFPVHDAEHIVIKDIEHWRDYVTPPNPVMPAAAWEETIKQAEAVDREEYFVAPFIAPGVFEQSHYLLEITNCLTAFYTNPDEMHEIYDMITEFELRYAEDICKNIKPDALFHHDDWGSQEILTSSHRPCSRKFILPCYKKIYGYYKDHGVQCIVHHSDSTPKTLCLYDRNGHRCLAGAACPRITSPKIISEYGGKLTSHGRHRQRQGGQGRLDPRGRPRGDLPGLPRVRHEYYIPCTTMGDPASIYPAFTKRSWKRSSGSSRKCLSSGKAARRRLCGACGFFWNSGSDFSS
jgi:hypothetical protein